MEVSLLNLGATIRSIRVPTDSGVIDAVLSYANLDDFLRDKFYIGTTAGRFANRIAGARFSIGEDSFSVDANEGRNCLHGGKYGFNQHFWQVHSREEETAVEYSSVSPDGECGFPGKLEVTVKYQLVNDFSLVIDFEARTDADTVVNLCNHAYFNLDPQQESIDSHDIQIDADQYTPVDDELIPSGEIRDVENTRFDLRNRTALSAAGSEDESKPAVRPQFCAAGQRREVAQGCHFVVAAKRPDHAPAYNSGRTAVLYWRGSG